MKGCLPELPRRTRRPSWHSRCLSRSVSESGKGGLTFCLPRCDVSLCAGRACEWVTWSFGCAAVRSDVGACEAGARFRQSRLPRNIGGLQLPIWTFALPFGEKKVRAHFRESLDFRHNEKQVGTMGSTKSVKGKPSKGKVAGPSKKSAKPKATGSAPTGVSKRKAKSLSLAKPGGAQKTKSSSDPNKRKKRVYTEKELDIPQLNGIIPAGIAKPKGQKKGKKFVDDAASMMAIMSVVNAEKNKDVESKIMRARHLEEIREAKRKEAEAKAEEKKAKFVSVDVMSGKRARC